MGDENGNGNGKEGKEPKVGSRCRYSPMTAAKNLLQSIITKVHIGGNKRSCHNSVELIEALAYGWGYSSSNIIQSMIVYINIIHRRQSGSWLEGFDIYLCKCENL